MTRARLAGASALLVLGALLCWLWLHGSGEARQAPAFRAGKARREPKPASAPPRNLLPAGAGLASADAAAAAGADVEHAKFEEPRTRFARRGPSNDDPGPGPYLERYQGRSGRLSAHASPDSSPAPVKNTSSSKDPELAVWALSTRVSAGQPGSVRAVLHDSSGQPLLPDRIEITRLGPNNAPLGAPAAMQAASASAGTAVEFGYDLPTSSPSDQAGRPAPPEEYRFLVRASGTFQGRAYQREAGGFFYAQHAGAKLDENSASTAFVRGNLELTVQIATQRAGNYFVSAELWGGAQGDQPIAFARQRLGQLSAGAQPVTLLFGGQIIEDAGIDGPYTVRNVQLLQVDAIPPHVAEPIAALAPTRAYRSQDFY